jgi:hypothetical protein
MKRSLRAFSATVFKLEERALLATLTPPPAPPTSTTYDVGFSAVTQEVSQQSSVATVILSRGIATGGGSLPFLQVQVTTDSSSPYVGVNVGAVNQTVTFAPNQIDAMLTVPIVAGAPNPGEVDVNLTVTPVDPSPDLNVSAPVDMLRILASDASIPPTIVATVGTPDGIEVIFNKPMDPAQASKVKNYAVSSESFNFGSSNFILNLTGHLVTTSVRLKSAEYNAATNTVTLIPRRRLTYGANVTLTQGRPAHAAGGPSAGTGAARGLVDLEGQPINQTTTPGKFSVSVYKGYGTPSFNL